MGEQTAIVAEVDMLAEIRDLLPHGETALYLVEITSCDNSEELTAIAMFPENPGHFPPPRLQVVRAADLIEAAAQAAGCLIGKRFGIRASNNDKMAVLTGVERAEFHGLVLPGEPIAISLTLFRFRLGGAMSVFKFRTEMTRENGRRVAEIGELTITVTPPKTDPS